MTISRRRARSSHRTGLHQAGFAIRERDFDTCKCAALHCPFANKIDSAYCGFIQVLRRPTSHQRNTLQRLISQLKEKTGEISCEARTRGRPDVVGFTDVVLGRGCKRLTDTRDRAAVLSRKTASIVS